jgi:DNA-binding NarL/FixJ family response regulator
LADEIEFDFFYPEASIRDRILNSDFDILLLDTDSAQGGAFDILQLIKARSPEKKVVFVCDNIGSDVLKSFRNGLDGCFSKKESTDEVTVAIAAVMEEKVHVPQNIIMNILYQGFVFTDFDTRLNQLTKREISVLHSISSTSTMKEAARSMKLAPSTLSAHKQHIMKKLRIETAQEFNNFLNAFGQWQKNHTLLVEGKK